MKIYASPAGWETGLGLNFVLQVVSLHSGDITLDNRDGGGTRAILSLSV